MRRAGNASKMPKLDKADKKAKAVVVEQAQTTERQSVELTVFVKNLDFTVSEPDLRELFGPCGAVAEIRLPRDQQGRSKASSLARTHLCTQPLMISHSHL